MRTVYLNGEFVPESEAKLSIYDLSVMQAAAAFEMTRSFHGLHFKLREHLVRLKDSCRLLDIPLSQDLYLQLFHLCCELALANDHGPGEEHRLLIVVSPGCAPMYRDLAGVIPHPFVYIADFPLRLTVQGFGNYFTEGVHCVTSEIEQLPATCVSPQAKHRSRLHFHLAQQQAPPGTWPLLTDLGGAYCEAPGANLIVVDASGGIGYKDDDCLQGISQRTIRDLHPEAEAWDAFDLDDLRMARELWLTGTPFCLLPVVSLDGQPIGDGTIGPVYRETLEKWNKLVGLDIAGQIQEWDAQRVGAT